MKLTNFGFRRKSGILLPVSALPSPYGIGSFGKAAYEFVDLLAVTGTKCWQVLPMNPTSLGDSPYQSPSVADGNWCYRLSPRYKTPALAQKIAHVTKKKRTFDEKIVMTTGRAGGLR